MITTLITYIFIGLCVYFGIVLMVIGINILKMDPRAYKYLQSIRDDKELWNYEYNRYLDGKEIWIDDGRK